MSDVLIVGAGPVGLTMALACQKQGLSFRLIDKLAAPSGLSKALGVWSAALEMLDGLGVADAFLTRGIHGEGMRISRGKRVLIELPAGFGVNSPFPEMILLPQCETENILSEALAARGGRIERGVECLTLRQDGADVETQLRHLDGGCEEAKFRWVVGCDGAHSAVRHLVGAEFEGNAMPEEYVLCDAHIEGEIAGGTLHLFWSSDGMLALFPVVRGVWRVLGTRAAAGKTGEPDLAEIQSLVDVRGPGGLSLHDPTWLSTFHISERKARSFRFGNVLLAGDAAHIHSPAGGQGMNTGMQDAFNLAWKLSLLSRGYGNAEAILDSYTAERSPVAARVLAESGRLIRSNLHGHPIAQLFRDNVVRLASRSNKFKKAMARMLSGLDIHYSKSVLVAGDEAWEEDWRPHGFAPGWRPRDAMVYRGNEPISLFGEWKPPLFTLLLFSGRRPIYRDVDRLAAVALIADGWSGQIRIVRVWSGDSPPPGEWLVDPDSTAHRAFGAEGSAFYLIRPDRYVALRSQPAEAGVLQSWLEATLSSVG